MVGLGRLLHDRRHEALQFKKNAGKYVGNYNWRRLRHITRRADLVALGAIGAGVDETMAVLNYVEMVLSINESAGEKAIPQRVKAMFPIEPHDWQRELEVLGQADDFVVRQFGDHPAILSALRAFPG